MNDLIGPYVPTALDAWKQMTLLDYGHVTLAVVLIGWVLTRKK